MDAVTITVPGLPSFITYNTAANKLEVSSSAPAGTFTIVLNLQDPWGLKTTNSFVLTINAPVAAEN